MPPEPSTTDQTYWAFISYRHTDNKVQDRDWATWLHQEIERYEIPAELVGTKNKRGDTIPERIYPVFRDEESLSANADLKSSIDKALGNSLFLVALCSPRTVESPYVDQEIKHFKSIGKGDRIIAAIIAGEPGHPKEECFPAPLREIVNPNGNLRKPLAADFRHRDGSEGYTSAEAYKGELLKTLPKREALKRADKYAERLQLMKLKIIAGILGLPIETIRDRDQAYQLQKAKRRQKILTTVITTITFFAIAATVGGFFAWKNQKLAEKQTGIATEKTALAEAEQKKQKELLWQASEASCEAGIAARNDGRNNEALAYFERGLRYAPENLRNGREVLNTSIFPDTPYSQSFARSFEGPISAIAFSPDGSRIAAGSRAAPGSNTGFLRLFDTRGTELWKTKIWDSFETLAFSPNGLHIATGSSDATLRLFDIQGTELWKAQFKHYISTLAFSPDSARIAVTSQDKSLRLFDTEGIELWKKEFEDYVITLAFSPDNSRIATGSRDRSLRLFDTQGTELWNKEFNSWVEAVTFSPDGSRITARSRDYSLSLFDTQGAELWKKEFESSELWRRSFEDSFGSVSFSPDGSRIAASSGDKFLRLFDIQGTELWKKEFEQYISTLAFSPDGSRIVASSKDKSLRLFDTQGTELWKKEFEQEVADIAFSPDSFQIAAGSQDSSLRLFLTQGSEQGSELWKKEFKSPVEAVAFSPDGSRVAAGCRDKSLRLLNIEGTELWKKELEGVAIAIAFSSEGSRVAAGCRDKSLRLLDTQGSELWKTKLEGDVLTLAFSPDGSHLAAGTKDKSLRLFDTQGTELWKTEFRTSASAITFSYDGSRIAAGALSAPSLRLFDTQGTELSKIRFEVFVGKIALSPDGSHFAAGCQDNSLRLFDTQGTELWKNEFEGISKALAFFPQVAISPDGHRIAVGPFDKSLRLFDTHGSEVWKTELESIVAAIAFSPDGSHLAAGSRDGSLRLFELIQTGNPSHEDIPLLSSWITQQSCLTFNQNGKLNEADSNEINTAHQTILKALTSDQDSSLHHLLRWKFTDPLHQTLSSSSETLLRDYLSQSLRTASNEANILSAHFRAPWHPLVPVSLASLERNADNNLRKKFLCQLTLKRLKAADPKIWGNDRLVEDATFAAGVMKKLGNPILAKETIDLVSSLQTPKKDE